MKLFTIPRSIAHQAPQSMEFSRQEYWSGQPFPSPGDLPDLGVEPGCPALQAGSLPNSLSLNSKKEVIKHGVGRVKRTTDKFSLCGNDAVISRQRTSVVWAFCCEQAELS